jgi:uncharacterized alpha-E superfamily protein/transglutaminase-like putative cysteine protease
MLLSRTAEAVYWAGRYLERAEDMARIVAVHGETHFDLPVGEDVGWGPLLAIAGTTTGITDPADELDRADDATRADDAARDEVAEEGAVDVLEASVVRHLLSDPDNPASVLCSLEAARRNLRSARAVVPREAWEVCNDLWLTIRPAPGGADPLDDAPRHERLWALRRVVSGCEHLNGILWGTMRRDEALAFFRIGQLVERADIIARVLRTRADSLLAADDDPYAEVRRAAVLRSMAAYEPFRRAVPATAASEAMLGFVLHDRSFPRAVAACIEEILGLVKILPATGDVGTIAADAAMVASEAAPPSSAAELAAYTVRLESALTSVHDELVTTYFPPAPDRGRGESRSRWFATAGDPASRIDSAMKGRYYRVRHRTAYRYDGPVAHALNEAHLRPRDTAGQACLDHVIEVDPVATMRTDHVDAFGNHVAVFAVGGAFDQLEVTATSDVVVAHPSATEPSSGGPPWEAARRLVVAEHLPASRQALPFRGSSRLVPTSPALAQYAAPSFAPGRDVVEATRDLCARIHAEFRYDPGFTSVTTPVLEVLEAKRGVCQDFAHLAVGCLRSLGLAARYVSGYLETSPPPGQGRLIGADASHAWASVYVPGWGWLDLDPTNDALAVEGYVTIAWGRDYWDVSPLRGWVKGGGDSHTLQVEVDVVRIDEVDPVPAPIPARVPVGTS